VLLSDLHVLPLG